MIKEISKKMIKEVRHIGLEPTRLTSPDPKSGAATNYANAASSELRRSIFRTTLQN